MKLIYKANDINEANIVSGMLHANGIESYVGGYYLQGGIGELAVQDFANIYVPEEDIAFAQSLIAEYELLSNPHDQDAESRSSKFMLYFVILLISVFTVFTYLVAS